MKGRTSEFPFWTCSDLIFGLGLLLLLLWAFVPMFPLSVTVFVSVLVFQEPSEKVFGGRYCNSLYLILGKC